MNEYNSANSYSGRRHKNFSMYYGLVALIVVIAFGILSTTVFFNIKEVRIIGSSLYTAEEILRASGISGGDNMIRTNMTKSSSSIEQELVYIEKAEIKRIFPSTVEITVTPCKETASILFDGGCYIISQSGKVVSVADEKIPDTIEIIGAEAAEDTCIGRKFNCENPNKTDIMYRLIEIAQSAADSRISSYDISDYLNISCLYEDRITIEFGAFSEFDYKLRLALSIISTKIGPETEGTLTVLSNGASFIDKAGLEQNEQIYQENILTSAQESEFVEENSNSNTDNSIINENQEETTSVVVNFE